MMGGGRAPRTRRTGPNRKTHGNATEHSRDRARGIDRSVAIAAGFGGAPPPRRMRLTKWKPHRAGALRGFATVRLPSGLLLVDCPVFQNSQAAWAHLPGKPQLDRAGCVVITNGVHEYEPIVSWPDRATHDRWSQAVIALVRAADPGAFAGVQ